jgi:hypothetical protein
MLNPFRVLDVRCIVHPGLSPGAIEVKPLSGFIASIHYNFFMRNMLTLKFTRMHQIHRMKTGLMNESGGRGFA